VKNGERTLITDKEEVTRKFKKVFKKILNILTKIETKGNSISTSRTIFRRTFVERG